MPSTGWCYPISASRLRRGADFFRLGGAPMSNRILRASVLLAIVVAGRAAAAEDATAYLKRAAAAKVDWVTRGGKSYAAVSFTEPGKFSATALFNGEDLVERVESRVPHPVLGDQRVVTEYSGYRDFGGVRFPAAIKQTLDGGGALELQVSEVRAGVDGNLQVPDAVRSATGRVAVEKAAAGVWYL